MTIELITGTPGAGKTTYAVAERIAKEVGREIEYEANGRLERVKRRVLVAGIGGLLVEHDRLPHTLTNDGTSEKVIEHFNQVDADGEVVFKRLRGEPPLEVPESVRVGGKELAAGCSLFNWWMWCQPGDLIVVDEVQYIVPRGVLGRKPPPFIALLEVHRHYGVDFLFITQHPQLLDTTIRNLVGMHRHVRSVMGSRVCTIYTWDHASNPDRLTNSTKSAFVRKKEHYALFKSAAAHVKPPSAGRYVLWFVPVLIFVAWFGIHRVISAKAPAAAAPVTKAAPAGAPGAAPSGLASLSGPARSAQASDRTWPTYVAEDYRPQREPLDGRAVQWEGGYQVGKETVSYFGLFVDGERVATVTLGELVKMGYLWTSWGPCVGSLRFGMQERLVTCAKKGQQPGQAMAAAVPASGGGV